MPSVEQPGGNGSAPPGSSSAEDRAPTEARTAPRGAPITLAIVLACLGATLLLGAAHKARCVGGDWADGRQYRTMCYTDIVPLFTTEQLTGGRLPFLDRCARAETNCDEYPVLTMYVMRAAAWVAGGHTERFFWANAILLSLCAAATAGCLYVMDARRALWFALAPSLALQAFVNWDLLAVALATASLLAFLRRREGWSGTLAGLGAAAKLSPALLLLPFSAERIRSRQPDRAITLWWSGAAAWLIVNLPFAALGLFGWWEFFRFNGARPADWDSGWYLACRHLSFCPPIGVINVASVVLLGATSWWVWVAKRRREPDFPRWQFAFPLLVLFLLLGKVYSPQFSLWLLPWLVLLLPGARRFLAFQAADVAVFLTRFSFFGSITPGVGGLPQSVFEVALLLRAGVLLWCVVGWVREPSRRLAIERPASLGAPVPTP